jgi:protein SCO1/2/putative membrane protein
LNDAGTVDRSYRLGILIVSTTVLASAAACAARVGTAAEQGRAAQDLGDSGFNLGAFRLAERSGRAVTDADLAGRVWVASFIFTRCPLSCPRITSVMKGLQGQFRGTGVELVSISVDPRHDSPDVLAEYARKFGAEADRWWFLTGSPAEIEGLVTRRFKLGLVEATPADREAGSEVISHSDRLALVDRGNRVVGYFDSNDQDAVKALVAKARALDGAAPAWARRLPGVNATLNGTCSVLLLVGWWLIRAGRVRAHATCMTLAVAVSALFLGCYLVYHYQVGSVPFRGTGPIRVAYFTVLLSHTLLATFGVVPLVALTFTRALRKQFDRHARIARVTFSIWLYVSITGVVIYLMLYRLPPSSPSQSAGRIASQFGSETSAR